MMDRREDMIDKIDPSHLEGFDSSDTEALESLYSAVLSLENVDELHRFFKDLCSYNELCSMIHRWEILRLIHKGMNYDAFYELIKGAKKLFLQKFVDREGCIKKGLHDVDELEATKLRDYLLSKGLEFVSLRGY